MGGKDHTWDEGFDVCNGVCPKCGINSDDVATCCAWGASWFRNCGPGKDHTWDEGLDVCKAASASAKGEQMQQQNTGQRKKNMRSTDDTNSNYNGLMNLAVFTTIFLTTVNLHL